GRGVLKLARGHGKEAAAEMQKCVPTFDLCHFHLALAQEKAGDLAGAQATRTTLLAQQRSQDTFFLALRAQMLKGQKKLASANCAQASGRRFDSRRRRPRGRTPAANFRRSARVYSRAAANVAADDRLPRRLAPLIPRSRPAAAARSACTSRRGE